MQNNIMVTIKFRGKSLLNKRWLFGSLVAGDAEPYISYRNYSSKVDPETVGQFIGLIDMSGNEIYEGDIISLKYTPESSSYLGYNPSYYNAEAIIVYNSLCFKGKNLIKWGKKHNSRNFQYFHLTDSGVSNIEVIGNIYSDKA